jgi:hypothetical protein
LDVVSGALGRLPNIVLHKKPRLADFAVWATAAEPLLGWPDGAFMCAYERNRSSANDLAMEASPIVGAVQSLVDSNPFEGTASDLLQALTACADEAAKSQKCWPANGRALSNALRRLVPNLRNCGVEVTFLRGSDRRRRRLIVVNNLASAPSRSSKESDCATTDATDWDASTYVMDEEIHSAVCENDSDWQDIYATADDVDARMQNSQPVSVATAIVGQSSQIGQSAGKTRIKGEL